MPTAVPARPKANRFFIAGAALLFLMLALGALAASRYESAEDWVDHSLDVQRELDGWITVIVELQSSTRAYVATGNRDLLDGHHALLLANERWRASWDAWSPTTHRSEKR